MKKRLNLKLDQIKTTSNETETKSDIYLKKIYHPCHRPEAHSHPRNNNADVAKAVLASAQRFKSSENED
jgi:hypothetical protein